MDITLKRANVRFRTFASNAESETLRTFVFEPNDLRAAIDLWVYIDSGAEVVLFFDSYTDVNGVCSEDGYMLFKGSEIDNNFIHLSLKVKGRIIFYVPKTENVFSVRLNALEY